MAVAKYKVLKEFEFDGVVRKLGEEIVCSDREAIEFIREKKVVESGFLDESDPKNADAIAEVETRSEERHDEIVASEEERAGKKEEREGEKDVKRAENIEKVKALVPDDENFQKEAAKLPDDALTELVGKLEAGEKIEEPKDEDEDTSDPKPVVRG